MKALLIIAAVPIVLGALVLLAVGFPDHGVLNG